MASDANREVLLEQRRAAFNAWLSEKKEGLKDQRQLWTREEYESICRHVRMTSEEMKVLSKQESRKAKSRRVRFKLVTLAGLHEPLLVTAAALEKATGGNGEVDPGKLVTLHHMDQFFDVLYQVHDQQRLHGGSRGLHDLLTRTKTTSISREICDRYVDFCGCRAEVQRAPPRVGVTPILSSSFNSRGQVDLIDFQVRL